MNLLKKIRIEIWVLWLAFLISFLFAISVGILVRQELVGSVKLGVISKAALFLAEIPSNFNRINTSDWHDMSTKGSNSLRFPEIMEFHGEPLEEETYLLLSKYDGIKESSIVELIDLRNFKLKKTWIPNISEINGLVDTSNPEFEFLHRDQSPKRYLIRHPFLTIDGGLIFKGEFGTPLVKIDRNSQLVWQNQEDAFHHSIEQDYEGNFWIPTYAFPFQISKEYVGSDYGNYFDDAIAKVSADGKILFQKSVSNILLENNLKILLFPATDDNFQVDPTHLNDIQPVLTDGPYWKRGDLFLSLRHQSMIILYRPSTNTIIWKSEGHMSAQHDVNILDDHRISIFNNNAIEFFNRVEVDGHNEVVIYDFKTDSYSKYFDESIVKHDIRTITQGKSRILDNGDLFIEDQNYGRLSYFNKDGSLQWQYVNRADNGAIYYVNWCRILYKSEDIKKVHQIIKN